MRPNPTVHHVHVLSIRFQLYTYVEKQKKEGERENEKKGARAGTTHFEVTSIQSLDSTTLNWNYRRQRETKGLKGRRVGLGGYGYSDNHEKLLQTMYTSIATLWLWLIFEYPEKLKRTISLFGIVKISGMFERCKNRGREKRERLYFTGRVSRKV